MKRPLAVCAMLAGCTGQVEADPAIAQPVARGSQPAFAETASAAHAVEPASVAAPSCSLGALDRCGGRGPEGAGDQLFSCAGGAWTKAERCARGCLPFPTALADRCRPEAPDRSALVASVATQPYVEERCVAESDPRFTSVKRCQYQVLGLASEIVVANPSAEQVVDWVIDAASYAEPLAALRAQNPAIWARGVALFVRHIKQQSSRIFPVSGQVVEDLGNGPTRFTFDRGVVTPCDRGNCRCRVNSLTPGAYCRYQEAMGASRAACLERYEGAGGDEAWRESCADNHAHSLAADHNENFRAKAFAAGQRVKQRCEAGCDPERVLKLLERELGLK